MYVLAHDECGHLCIRDLREDEGADDDSVRDATDGGDGGICSGVAQREKRACVKVEGGDGSKHDVCDGGDSVWQWWRRWRWRRRQLWWGWRRRR